MVQKVIRNTGVAAALAALLLAGGCRKKAYENPIAKDTQQPDKVLFDSAMSDVEHGRYEKARLTLQTMMNTYDTSEYLAKAKLLVADSWYREGGAHGFAQAEAEYKDFILFYPTMEEAAEAQSKICDMQYQQMDKSDRDPTHAFRADEECRNLLTQFPNSKFAPQVAQKVRDIQEVLGDREFKVGDLYFKKGSFPASANRFQGLTDQYPLYSRADDALWLEAQDYKHMGDRFEEEQAAAYAKLVRDYPLSAHADDAKSALEEMKRPVPQADPVAVNRMKYELENRKKRGLVGKAWAPFSSRPDITGAAQSGTPEMGRLSPTIPRSVPASAAGAPATTNSVTVETPANPNVLDKSPDARMNPPGAAQNGAAGGTPETGSTSSPAAASVGANAAAPPAAGAPDAAKPAAAAPATASPAANSQASSGKNSKSAKAPKKKTPKKKKNDSNSKTDSSKPDTTKQDPNQSKQ